jgi:hypothetical protein
VGGGERKGQAQGDVCDSEGELQNQRAPDEERRLSKRFDSKGANYSECRDCDDDQREDAVRPVNRHQRLERQQAALAGAPELAQHVEGVGEIHRRHHLPAAQRQVEAGKRRIVRAYPAAERDLRALGRTWITVPTWYG